MEKILDDLKNDLKSIKSIHDLNDIKVKYLGKKGLVTSLYSKMKELTDEDKKSYGASLNNLKNEVTKLIDFEKEKIETKILNEKLEKESIDISLPATNVNVGAPSILEKLIEDIENLLMSMGYDVIDGPEVEKDEYNFEMLNLPKGHPARDAQDTFYVKGEELLLRSQTSPVQIRSMLAGKGEVPIRMICPGKTYRRDDDDATHSHQFMQIEGLLVDKNISLSDLKGTFDVIAKHLFGDECQTRFRPSYYPFTEPSVEMDITCHHCKGEGCAICKNTGFITVSGGGMVHPKVLENCGYDPKKWSGFAFGFGAERLAMIKYGIDDLRVFYTNDLRESRVFDRKEAN